MNNFGNETTDHITEEEVMKWMRQISGDGISNLVKKIHFDKNAPENHNIKIQSSKKKTVKVFNDGKWELQDTHYAIGRMIDNGTALMHRIYNQPDSKIKYEDQHTHNLYIMRNLLDIFAKEPQKYKKIARQIYIHILNLFYQQGIDLSPPDHIDIKNDDSDDTDSDSD